MLHRYSIGTHFDRYFHGYMMKKRRDSKVIPLSVSVNNFKRSLYYSNMSLSRTYLGNFSATTGCLTDKHELK